MVLEVTVPKFAEGAKVIRLRRWLFARGEPVQAGAHLAEAATDKISIYIEAPGDGSIVELLAAEGDEVLVGQVIARLAADPAGR